MSKPDYDTTVARVAGNIASGLMNGVLTLRDGSIDDAHSTKITVYAVDLARLIIAEVKRTEPQAAPKVALMASRAATAPQEGQE